jgi:hypothetical protein
MANFPDIPPSESYTPSLENFTFLADGYPSGVQLARAGRLFQLYACSMRYENISYASLQTLWDFHRSVRGRLTPFTFTDWAGWDATPVGIAWPRLYVATTDGTTTVFDVPMKSSSTSTLYRANVALTISTDYTFSAGAGTDGRDRITLVAAGASGDLLEWSATGRAASSVRFASDKFPMTFFSNGVASCSMDVIGAL